MNPAVTARLADRGVDEPLEKHLAVTLTIALADPNRQGETVEPKSD